MVQSGESTVDNKRESSLRLSGNNLISGVNAAPDNKVQHRFKKASVTHRDIVKQPSSSDVKSRGPRSRELGTLVMSDQNHEVSFQDETEAFREVAVSITGLSKKRQDSVVTAELA